MYQLMDPHTKRHDEGLFEQVPESVYERVTAHRPDAPYSNETTSKAAAVEIESKVHQDRYRIWSYLCEVGPLTDEAIAHDLRMSPNTVRPRRGELVEMGCVIDAGERQVVKSGNKAIAWKPLQKHPDPRWKRVKARQQERPSEAA